MTRKSSCMVITSGCLVGGPLLSQLSCRWAQWHWGARLARAQVGELLNTAAAPARMRYSAQRTQCKAHGARQHKSMQWSNHPAQHTSIACTSGG